MYQSRREVIKFQYKLILIFFVIYFIVGGIIILIDHNRRESVKREKRLEEIRRME